MPKLTNMVGPDYQRIRTFGDSFASCSELTSQNLVMFERILKLAAECSQVNFSASDAASVMDRVSNPLRSAIGCGQMHVASPFGDASLLIVPDAA